jgi:Uma2 family endonuclease
VAREGAVPVDSIALLVEVADTTMDRDTGRKLELYAAAGVPEYWVVDVNAGQVLMHDDPRADGYRGRRAVVFADMLVSATVEGLAVDGAELIQ